MRKEKFTVEKSGNPAGILLRMERLRQNKGQREVCYGICVVSYLSKIERGMALPDENLVAQLFARLGITYERDEAFLAESLKLMETYLSNLRYGLNNEEVFEKLRALKQRLLWSPFVIDALLVFALESVFHTAGSEVAEQETESTDYFSILEQLQGCMDRTQFSYYCLLLAKEEKDKNVSLAYRKKASEGLNNTLGLRALIYGYYDVENYNEIHRLEQRLTAMALEEGNVYALADYYFINATAYACVNMEEMMENYYERARHLLQNTGWWEETANDWNYNMGATYLELGKYNLALNYLNQVTEEYFLLWHKKALLNVRLGNISAAEPLFRKMEEYLKGEKEGRRSDTLMYEELRMECEPGFLEKPEYLELLEELLKALRKERHFGFLYEYKNVVMEAYTKQRKYKKALEFQNEISCKMQKGVC